MRPAKTSREAAEACGGRTFALAGLLHQGMQDRDGLLGRQRKGKVQKGKQRRNREWGINEGVEGEEELEESQPREEEGLEGEKKKKKKGKAK